MRFVKWKVISWQMFWPWKILKWISKKYDRETSIWTRTVTIRWVSKYFDEILFAAQSGKFLEYLENVSFSRMAVLH